MNTKNNLEYAAAVQAYLSAVAEHEDYIAASSVQRTICARKRTIAKAELEAVIDRIGSDPMGVLKKPPLANSADDDLQPGLDMIKAAFTPLPGER